QLTVRAILMGCGIGAVVSAMNLYLGLMTGWSLGGSLIAAILGFGILGTFTQALRKSGSKIRPYGVLETNITQTAGSAAGSMTSAAGLLAAIPAMNMLGHDLGYVQLTLWALSVAYLGVFFAVPLRRQMVVAEKLRFPTGTATAETIVSMAASGAEAVRKARMLAIVGLAAGAYALAFYFVPELNHPAVEAVIPAFSVVAVWSISLLLSPMMFGAGILIGPRVGTSLLLGALVAWVVVAPIITSMGLVAGPFVGEDGVWSSGSLMSFSPLTAEKAAKIGAPQSMVGLVGGRAWLLWPGVALMIADALTTLGLNWRSVLNTFLPGKGDSSAVDNSPDTIPTLWWVGGLGLATILVTVMAQWLFEIPFYFTLIAVALSALLAAIAVRSTGETDINPIGGMGKVTQLVFAGLAPGVSTNLMAAAITGSGASQAGDMMQDLKTGYLLGASPRKQFLAQLVGIAAGIIVCVPAYLLFDAAYDIGGVNQDIENPLKALPAPAAHAWKGFAELLSNGIDSLPEGALYAVFAGLALGVVLPILRLVLPKAAKGWVPSGLAMGIAFIVPAYYCIVMFIGSMFLVGWQRVNKKGAAAMAFAVASGLVAGEGLMGIVSAILQILGVPNLWEFLDWIAKASGS
ncbi:MAG: OPT family oligopeptide transporter, partial [Myxococcota bacterium]